MRRFSRWMKSMPAEPTVSATLLGVTVVLALVAAMLLPGLRPAGFTLLGIVAFSVVWAVVDLRRLRALKVRRSGEDIGTFARAFDRHACEFDPLLLRAVWDALQSQFGAAAPVPLRPTDRIADLRIDEEDLFDMLPRIAERTGRTFDRIAYATHNRDIQTVGDFVALLATAPRATA